MSNFSDAAGVILSNAQRVETMGNTVSGKLLALYNEVADAEAFDKACSEAETIWKAKRAKAKESTNLPSCWTQAKSDIKGAVKAGIDASQYSTVSSLKAAKVKANKAAKAAKAPTATAPKAAPASLPKTGKSKHDVMVAKFAKLSDVLGQLSQETADALIDSFLAQAEKAVKVASSDTVTSTKAETKRAANA